MQSKAKTIGEYLDSLPEDRRRALEAIRRVIRENIDPAFAEGMQYGMPSYYLPHSRYPRGYHCDPKQPLPFASFASQKNHIALYLFCASVDPQEQAAFRKDWLASGKRLDMGASCVRVKKLEDIPLDVVGRLFARVTARKLVAAYEAGLAASVRRKPGNKAAKKPARKKPTKRRARRR